MARRDAAINWTQYPLLTLFGTNRPAQAQERVAVEAVAPLPADTFLSSSNAGRMALILEYGNGADLASAQRAGRLSITSVDKCYLLPPGAIRKSSVWLMVNSEATSKSRGRVTLRVTASHYKVGEVGDKATLRKLSRVKRYTPIEFDLSPEISKSPSDQRVAFYTGINDTDLVVLDVRSSNPTYRDMLDGRYYLMLNDRVAYENLVPGCRKTRILGFLSIF